MKHPNYDRQAAILKTIANPVRLRIMQLLTAGEVPVGTIVRETGLEQSLISHNLILMADRGVLSARREGKQIYYSLTDVVRLSAVGQGFTVNVSLPTADA